jgi:hypothetical protein
MQATEKEKDPKKAMRTLLLAYQQQLLHVAETMRHRGEAVPPNIEDAITHNNYMFGHFMVHRSAETSESEVDYPKPTVIIEEAIALSRIKDLPTGQQLQVGQSYQLEVDIVQDLQDNSLPINLLSEQSQSIGIVIQADDMIIQPDWHQDVIISPDGRSKSPEFTLIPLEPGYKTITVQYYYKSHWLTQLIHEVEVIRSGTGKSKDLYSDIDSQPKRHL